ncbi:MAG: hypothetical protein J6J11_00175 [Treponema sp.]|nr:hypothetical protein [Treponema sp.]
MLLPDNIKPEYSIYYVGSLILNELYLNGSKPLLDLFEVLNKDYETTFSLYSLALDWLYLIEAAEIKSTGEVHLCL